MILIKCLLASLIIFGKPTPSKDPKVFFDNLASESVLSRALKATEYFINTPSGLDPLGEEKGLDPDPLFSTKKFDCTTYVETVLSIANSKEFANAPLILNQIRYESSKISFFHRNHFIVSDWIPSNVHKGFVKDITSSLSSDPLDYKNEMKLVKKTLWFYHRTIDLLDQQKKSPQEILDTLKSIPQVPNREDKARYLLSSFFRKNAQDMFEKLPEISVMMFIRNIPSSPTLVNHMGFIIKKDNQLYLNHAPQAKPWKVKEELLEDYFVSMDSHKAPVEGILVLSLAK